MIAFLQLAVCIYTLSGIAAKLASGYPFLSAGAHHIGVDHIHQLRVALPELGQHPDKRGKDSGSQIAEPIFQRKPSFSVSLS